MNQSFILTLHVLQKTLVPELSLLEELCEKMWDTPGPQVLKRMVESGELWAYLTPKGLILLEPVDWSKGRELSIYGMVGRDILTRKYVGPIMEDLKAIAAYNGCSMLGGVGVPKGWQKKAPALGFKPVSTHFVMEL